MEKNMRITVATLIIVSFFAANTANAELKSTSPSEVCDWMKDMELKTIGWKQITEEHSSCSSNTKELDSGFPNANTLFFQAVGDSKAVNQTTLILYVNNPKSAKVAHEELLKAAEALSEKAAGEKLPKALRQAIKSGKITSAKVGSASVEVTRENWLNEPSGKGHVIKVIIK